MKARLVVENIRFEKDPDTKRSLRIGKERFRRPGDVDIIPGIVERTPDDDDPHILLVNLENGREKYVGLYAAKEVIQTLKTLFGNEG